MKTLGITLCLISLIMIFGIIIKLMFGIGLLWGLITVALILGLIGICLVDATEKGEEYYYDDWI